MLTLGQWNQFQCQLLCICRLYDSVISPINIIWYRRPFQGQDHVTVNWTNLYVLTVLAFIELFIYYVMIVFIRFNDLNDWQAYSLLAGSDFKRERYRSFLSLWFSLFLFFFYLKFQVFSGKMLCCSIPVSFPSLRVVGQLWFIHLQIKFPIPRTKRCPTSTRSSALRENLWPLVKGESLSRDSFSPFYFTISRLRRCPLFHVWRSR